MNRRNLKKLAKFLANAYKKKELFLFHSEKITEVHFPDENYVIKSSYMLKSVH